ncbi:MAG: HepT-like ribonuclease domain-containing protein [Opitutaceae bacterium]
MANGTTKSFRIQLHECDTYFLTIPISWSAVSRHARHAGMRGMRNIIAHDYGAVDLELVWKTASTDVQFLIDTLETHFGSPGGGESRD